MKKVFLITLGVMSFAVLAVFFSFKITPTENLKSELLLEVGCKSKLEGAGVIGGKAGVHCTANPGDCKKVHPCEALGDLSISPTNQEIINAAELHANDFTARGIICNDPISWEASKQAAIDSYNSFYSGGQ